MIGRNGNVDDKAFGNIPGHYTTQEIVELAIAATQYLMTRLLTRSFQILLEIDGRSAAPARCS